MKNKTLRGLAVAGVTAVATMSVVGGAIASAQNGGGNIDTNRTGSLTVHKFLHQSGDHEGDIGSAPAPGDFTDPVEGVQFIAHELIPQGSTFPLDLGDPASWDLINNTEPGVSVGTGGCTAPEGFEFGANWTATTDESGMAHMSDMRVTAYQVCEWYVPSGVVDRMEPAIVTIPMPNSGEWLYDVNIYPKNSSTGITKTIVPQEENGLALGSQITYPISVTIPAMVNEQWTSFAVQDQLDSRLSYDSATVEINGAPVNQAYYEITTEEIAEDLNPEEAPGEFVFYSEVVNIEFTEAGLQWLTDTPSLVGESLDIVLDTTVNSSEVRGYNPEVVEGFIPNTAFLYVNAPDFRDGNDSPIISDRVTTYWGEIELLKQDAESQASLEGAVFELYPATTPYTDSCTDAEATGDPVSFEGQTQFTSDADGIVSFPSVFVFDDVNNLEDQSYGARCYVVREVSAPSGYTMPEDADTGVATQFALDPDRPGPITIVNTQQSGPTLPLTGGGGTGVLLGLGGALVLGAGGLALAKRRNDDKVGSTTA